MNVVWILGNQYDLTDKADVDSLFDVISDKQHKGYSGDLTLIASSLLVAAVNMGAVINAKS